MTPGHSDPRNHVPKVSGSDTWDDSEPVTRLEPPTRVASRGALHGAPVAPVPTAAKSGPGLRIGNPARPAATPEKIKRLDIEEFGSSAARLESDAPPPRVERIVTFHERPALAPDTYHNRGESGDWGKKHAISLRWILAMGAVVVTLVVLGMIALPSINAPNAIQAGPATQAHSDEKPENIVALNRLLTRQPEAIRIYRSFLAAAHPDDLMPIIRDAAAMNTVLRQRWEPTRQSGEWQHVQQPGKWKPGKLPGQWAPKAIHVKGKPSRQPDPGEPRQFSSKLPSKPGPIATPEEWQTTQQPNSWKPDKLPGDWTPTRIPANWEPASSSNWSVMELEGHPCALLTGRLPDNSKFQAYFTGDEDQLLLDWKATTGYGTAVFKDLVQGRGNGSEIRGEAALTDYYSQVFPEDIYQAFRLVSPDGNEYIWCYAARKSAAYASLASELQAGAILTQAADSTKATLALERGPDGSQPNQWLISDLLQIDWVAR